MLLQSRYDERHTETEDPYNLLCSAIKSNNTLFIKHLLADRIPKDKNKKKKAINTPLHFAAKNGNLEILEMLLEKGAKVNARNSTGKTPLHNAIKTKQIEVTEFLLNHGADVNIEDKKGFTPLLYAIESELIEHVKVILKHESFIDSVENFINTKKADRLLHFSAGIGDPQCLTLLLKKGLDPNVITDDSLTPLCIAIRNVRELNVYLLLQYGANVNYEDKDGKTILHLAVEMGNSNIVKNILNSRPDINNESNKKSLKSGVHGIDKTIVKDLLEYGFTIDPKEVDNCDLLHSAAKMGHNDIIKELLNNGANVEALNELRHTLLHSAVIRNQLETVELLLRHGADINALDSKQNTPLYYATELNHLNLAKLLITNGADVKINLDLLHLAVSNTNTNGNNANKEIIELLLQKGVYINSRNRLGKTPLHFTTSWHYVADDMVTFLLSKGADVNASSHTGLTALHEAVYEENVYVIETLLQHNANVNCIAQGNVAPLHYACDAGSVDIISMLLNKGANVNAKQNDGTTALHIATGSSTKSAVELLLQWGADVNSKLKKYQTTNIGIVENSIFVGRPKKDYNTPLHIAVQKGRQGHVELLLKYGADVDSKNHDLRTPLHLANNENIVKMLLNAHADVDSRDKQGASALLIAAEQHNKEIIEILLNNGADINIFTTDDGCVFDLNDNCDDKFDYFRRNDILDILEEHIIKLNAANFYVDEVFLKDADDTNFKEKCQSEIKKMKNWKINNISYYDILTKNIGLLAVYAKNDQIIQALQSDHYQKELPIYASMIEHKFREGMERRKLLEEGNKYFQYLFTTMNKLPYECIDKIFSFLDNKDLRLLLKVCKPFDSVITTRC